MNQDRMTQRVQEALNAAYTRAVSEHNTETTPEHLLAAILDQTEGIARPILEKAGLDPQAVDQRAQTAIGALPRYQGAAADQSRVTVSPGITRLFAKADDEAKALSDDYVSIEHLLLAMTADAGAVGSCSAISASRARSCSLRSQTCAATSASRRRTPKARTSRSSGTGATSRAPPNRASSIR